MVVERDKPLRDYTAADFVKYFAKKYSDAYHREYHIVFARDCSIMLKVMRKFFEADVPFKDIFPFIDKMFIEYPKRRRIKSIDLNWLYGVVDIYLNVGDKFEGKSGNKVKAPVELDDDMKEWLKKEKEKWLK
jgi:hypothetical protein